MYRLECDGYARVHATKPEEIFHVVFICKHMYNFNCMHPYHWHSRNLGSFDSHIASKYLICAFHVFSIDMVFPRCWCYLLLPFRVRFCQCQWMAHMNFARSGSTSIEWNAESVHNNRYMLFGSCFLPFFPASDCKMLIIFDIAGIRTRANKDKT